MATGRYALVDEKVLMEERKLQRTAKLSPIEENACDEKKEGNNQVNQTSVTEKENRMMFTALDTGWKPTLMRCWKPVSTSTNFKGTESRRNVKTIGSFLCTSLSSLK